MIKMIRLVQVDTTNFSALLDPAVIVSIAAPIIVLS